MKMICPAEKRLNAQQVLEHPWVMRMADKPEKMELTPIVTRQLQIFGGAQRIKKVVLTYLATQLSEKEMGPMKRMFMGLDKNGDGILSREEVREGLKGHPEEQQMIDIINALDTDCSGFVDYNGMVRGKRNRGRVPGGRDRGRCVPQHGEAAAGVQRLR